MEKLYYHAFTDNKDEYFNTFSRAHKWLRALAKEGYSNLRIYELFDDGENLTDGDCLYSKGQYPL